MERDFKMDCIGAVAILKAIPDLKRLQPSVKYDLIAAGGVCAMERQEKRRNECH
jgi:hypothetical protein